MHSQSDHVEGEWVEVEMVETEEVALPFMARIVAMCLAAARWPVIGKDEK